MEGDIKAIKEDFKDFILNLVELEEVSTETADEIQDKVFEAIDSVSRAVSHYINDTLCDE